MMMKVTSLFRIQILQEMTVFTQITFRRRLRVQRIIISLNMKKKILVWIAISPMGMREPYFRQQGMAVNRFVYRDVILEPYYYHSLKNIINMISLFFGQIRRIHIMPRRFRIGYFPKKLNFCQTASNRRRSKKDLTLSVEMVMMSYNLIFL